MELKIYSEAEALKTALDYFSGDEMAAKVWVNKYALRSKDNEILESSPDQMHRRIADEIARIETKMKYPNPLTSDQAYEYLKGFKRLIFGGSANAGIGNNHSLSSLSNCFVIESPHDSYSGIYRSGEQQTQLMKMRGGVGKDLSNIRPSGASVSNAAKTSTGVVPIAERYSNDTKEVAQNGRRKVA